MKIYRPVLPRYPIPPRSALLSPNGSNNSEAVIGRTKSLDFAGSILFGAIFLLFYFSILFFFMKPVEFGFSKWEFWYF